MANDPKRPADFLFAEPKSADSDRGNCEHAVVLCRELKRVVRQAYFDAPRTRQRRPGPSQLGGLCDRRIVAHFLEMPKVNRMTDPWAAIVGTGTHGWLADAFTLDNKIRAERADPVRWLVEQRVVPPGSPGGSTDLYDKVTHTVTDHKVLGDTTHGSLVKSGPSLSYEIQLLMYAAGVEALGEEVKHIAIAAYRRSGRLPDLYVWSQPYDDAARERLALWVRKTQVRADVADLVRKGTLTLDDVPKKPSAKECRYCDFYAKTTPPENGAWYCPGRAVLNEEGN